MFKNRYPRLYYEYICKFKWDQTNNEDMVMQIINLKNIYIYIIKTA